MRKTISLFLLLSAGSFAWGQAKLPSGAADGALKASDIAVSGVEKREARAVADKLKDVVNGRDFGMKCDGEGDDTTALQAALSSGRNVHLPSGVCLVTNAEVINAKSQVVEGEGRDKTIIEIPPKFDQSAAGVFVAKSGEVGPTFRDFGIRFVQPNTSSRSALVNYPVALYLQNTPRFTIQNMRISGAINGVDMRGNSGGAFIDTLELSAFGTGINIDGSLDTVRIHNLHAWPFNTTADQRRIYNDGEAIGILSGRCDGLDLSDVVFINNGAQIKLVKSAKGTTFGYGTNLDFDTHGGLVMQAGRFSISSSFFSVGDADNQAIKLTGGDLTIVGSRFESSVPTRQPFIEVNGPGYVPNGSHLQITGSTIATSGDMPVVLVGTSSPPGNTVILSNNQFELQRNSSQSHSVVSVIQGGNLTMIGNRVSDHGSGKGDFVTFEQDGAHVVAFNALSGWGGRFPASKHLMQVYGNIGMVENQ